MSDVEIRPTIPTDLDALAHVLVDVYEADGYPVEGVDDPNSWLTVPNPIGQWTALRNGSPVGHVAVLRPSLTDGAPALLEEQQGVNLADVAVLARLFVAPNVRGGGVGNALLRKAEHAAHLHGYRLVLDVLTKDQAAIALYEARGWVAIGAIDHSYGNNRATAQAFVAPAPS